MWHFSSWWGRFHGRQNHWSDPVGFGLTSTIYQHEQPQISYQWKSLWGSISCYCNITASISISSLPTTPSSHSHMLCSEVKFSTSHDCCLKGLVVDLHHLSTWADFGFHISGNPSEAASHASAIFGHQYPLVACPPHLPPILTCYVRRWNFPIPWIVCQWPPLYIWFSWWNTSCVVTQCICIPCLGECGNYNIASKSISSFLHQFRGRLVTPYQFQ